MEIFVNAIKVWPISHRIPGSVKVFYSSEIACLIRTNLKIDVQIRLLFSKKNFLVLSAFSKDRYFEKIIIPLSL